MTTVPHTQQASFRNISEITNNRLPLSSGMPNDGFNTWAAKRGLPNLVQYQKILGMDNRRGKQMVLTAFSKNLSNNNIFGS